MYKDGSPQPKRGDGRIRFERPRQGRALPAALPAGSRFLHATVYVAATAAARGRVPYSQSDAKCLVQYHLREGWNGDSRRRPVADEFE